MNNPKLDDRDDGSNKESSPQTTDSADPLAARPLVFDLARAGMRRKLEVMALAGSILSVFDPLPRRDAYGRWIFFPWTGRLVHVLPPEELRAARSPGRVTGRRRVAIVGLGLSGSIALALLREGMDCAFRLADQGLVHHGDLRHMPVGVHDVGSLKTEAIARAMYEIDPFVEIECVPEPRESGEMDAFLVEGGGTDLLLLGSSDPQGELARRAREFDVPTIQPNGGIDVDALRHILEGPAPRRARST